jgi:hypothetical protein
MTSGAHGIRPIVVLFCHIKTISVIDTEISVLNTEQPLPIMPGPEAAGKPGAGASQDGPGRHGAGAEQRERGAPA